MSVSRARRRFDPLQRPLACRVTPIVDDTTFGTERLKNEKNPTAVPFTTLSLQPKGDPAILGHTAENSAAPLACYQRA